MTFFLVIIYSIIKIMANEVEVKKNIEDKILTIRNQQVMIDRDLAELYEVETKVLNQAVKRNIERFPERFMFQLTTEEAEIHNSSRSQNVTLNKSNNKRGTNIKYLPYAFTEQGCAMLSSVLKSETASKSAFRLWMPLSQCAIFSKTTRKYSLS